VTYPGEDEIPPFPPELDLAPHDEQCEVVHRDRGYLRWPSWKSCQCKARREARSKDLPERPLRLTWLGAP
jgi:hypothetical protein